MPDSASIEKLKSDLLLKVIGVLTGIIVSLASVTGTLFLKDIRKDVNAVKVDLTNLKSEEVKSLLKQVNDIQTDLISETFNKQTMIYRLDRLEADIKDLEEKVP